MRFNIIYNKNISNYSSVLEVIENTLIKNKVEFKSQCIDDMENFGDFTFVIGGDGTLLKAARFYANYKTPVLGINQGRLGFLSQTTINDFGDTLDNIINNNFFIEERMMLCSEDKTALNDIVIKGCNAYRTSKFYLEINGNCVCNYIADGVIISTPTGSTAYGLSAGGPVLYPTLNAITIVPICPHTLNVRPLVVPAEEKLSIKTEDTLLSISTDGGEASVCKDKIHIKVSGNKAYLAFLKKGQFYSVLRNKLQWGIAPSEK